MNNNGIPDSWLGEFRKVEPQSEPQPEPPSEPPSIDGYVRSAIDAAKGWMGQHESLNDVVGPTGIDAFNASVDHAIEQLVTARAAIAALEGMLRDDVYADPVLTAVIQLFGLRGDDVDAVARQLIERHTALLRLPIDESELPAKRSRGRPPVSLLARAAVHWLSDQGLPYYADFEYTDRAFARTARRSTNEELPPKNAAAEAIVSAVARSGLTVGHSEIRRHARDYATLLNSEGSRKPTSSDYTSAR